MCELHCRQCGLNKFNQVILNLRSCLISGNRVEFGTLGGVCVAPFPSGHGLFFVSVWYGDDLKEENVFLIVF